MEKFAMLLETSNVSAKENIINGLYNNVEMDKQIRTVKTMDNQVGQ